MLQVLVFILEYNYVHTDSYVATVLLKNVHLNMLFEEGVMYHVLYCQLCQHNLEHNRMVKASSIMPA